MWRRSIALCALVAAAAMPTDDASTARCLASSVACDDAAPCPIDAAFTRKCLDAHVPFRTAYSRVKCCLRCCFDHFVAKYGLDDNFRRLADRGVAAGAVELAFRPLEPDELLMGENTDSTLAYASRSLTKSQNSWPRKVTTRDRVRGGIRRDVSAATFGPEMRLECRGDDCTANDRRDTDRRLWSTRRSARSAISNASQRFDAGETDPWAPGWVEAHLIGGSNACNYWRERPYGAFRGITLAALHSAAALAKGPPRLSLVTATDCDLPHARAFARGGFRGETSLLDAPGLHAWFTTNPAGSHPKLRAIPIGVRDRATWIRAALDGRETLGNRTLLACCCMKSFPTPALLNQSDEPLPPKLQSMLSFEGDFTRTLNDVPRLVGPGGADRRRDQPIGKGEIYGRVRRFAIVETLRENGLGECARFRPTEPPIHGVLPPSPEGFPAGFWRKVNMKRGYTNVLLAADFVVSPQGKGRACHREWEVLSAGGIPLVDADASPAMASLYGELPIVRVKDWRHVTEAVLERERRRIFAAAARGEISMRKLYLPYWIARLTEHLEG